MRRAAALLGLVVALLCPAPAGSGANGKLRGGSFEPPRAAPDFELAASDGATFRLSRHRGKVVALAFGYTHCPDVCPTVLAELAEMRAQMGTAASERVQVVYVTVDPDRDTVERLRTYMRAFDPTFLGLTGPPGRLAEVWKAYGITVSRQADTTGWYAVHHSAFVYLVDPRGRLRAMLPFGTPVEDVAHDVRLLLRE